MTKNDRWQIEVRTIYLVLRGFAIPSDWTKPPKVNDHGTSFRYESKLTKNPKRIAVLNAVARACRYPTFLLKGDPTKVVTLLKARKERKLSESYGVFRNRAGRRRAEQG